MQLLEDLRRDGIHLPAPMAPGEVSDIVASLASRRMFASHVAAKATEPPAESVHEALARGWPVFSPVMADVVMAPRLLEHALRYFWAARYYFGGAFPRLYSLNAFWTCPTPPGHPLYTETQAWHRDGDDAHQFTIFAYGTDVLVPEDGEHLYQRGTHLVDDDHIGWPFREEPPDPSTVAHVLGPRGTVMIVDTNGLHKAIRPSTRPRLLLWARWGTANPPRSYAWDQLHPVPRGWLGSRYPTDPEIQEAIRLVVA